MTDNKRIDETTGTQTVGHEWDGIEELDTPMPRWWLWTLYATIIWGVIYTIMYPAWPMIESATAGTLGWSSRGQLEKEMADASKARAPITAALNTASVGQILADGKLRNVAIQGGSAAFKVHCVQCHGTGADGIRPGSGYPNLNDDDWLWGGDIDAIHYTLVNGVRQPDHDGTRTSQMPAFGAILKPQEIDALTAYVRSLSGLQKVPAKSNASELFANNCAVCHGNDGKGLREFGAPNLTDGIWLYGSRLEEIETTIRDSRFGVMPRWNNKLDPVTIKMLAVHIHSLGGGEATPTKEAVTGVNPKSANAVKEAADTTTAAETSPTPTKQPTEKGQ